MDLSFFQSLIFGFLSGLTDILPVSAQAHKTILLKLFGISEEPLILRFLIHVATLAALYFCTRNHLMRINRQLKLARIPKKRRKRPVDGRTIMDFKLLRTMVIPVIFGFLFYYKTSAWNQKLNVVAIFALLNAVILYLPVLLPSGNKDSRSLSRMEGVLMGLGGATAILPGMSSVGAINSVSSLCGAERTYGLNMSLIMQMAVTVGMIVFDVVAMFGGGLGALSFGVLLGYMLAAVTTFVGVFCGIRIMRTLAVNIGFNGFAYYSLGIAMFSFILFLTSP